MTRLSPSSAHCPPVAHLHQAGVLVGGEAVDVIAALRALGLQEAGEALLYVVGAGDLLLPVVHVDLQHLGEAPTTTAAPWSSEVL